MKSTPAPRPPQANRPLVLALTFVLTLAGGGLTGAAGDPGEVPPIPDLTRGGTKDDTHDWNLGPTGISLMTVPVRAQSSDFYAYYTRLAYHDDNNTGKYADIVVNLGATGQFVFSREYSYLPYWQVSNKKHFAERIVPFVGDGPAGRPDKINQCSHVRIIEDTPDRIVIHWRYAPDQRRDSFTHFRKTYCGDMGGYFDGPPGAGRALPRLHSRRNLPKPGRCRSLPGRTRP